MKSNSCAASIIINRIYIYIILYSILINELFYVNFSLFKTHDFWDRVVVAESNPTEQNRIMYGK